jgi:hypothetical protein
MPDHNSIPAEVSRIYDSWERYRRIWWFIHYLIGIVGVVASITVANKPHLLQSQPLILNSIAWISAMCVTLLVFLEPRKRARAYTTAWRLLHQEIGKFRHSQTEESPTVLFEAVAKGEEHIAKLDG